MKTLKYFSSFFMALALLSSLGCASTPTQESTGQYFDDSIITTKVKAAIFNEPTLKSSEIKVTTIKGVVELSGQVSSRSEIRKAVEVAREVKGVQSIRNNLQSK
ncbi:MAG TPA: BON domain-containing protein [Gallionella sp.]|nr:BON domain-containing protein [Gallionella sp.]